jgi:threonine dehydrogenase-like Zn-dependent dehydrogenase
VAVDPGRLIPVPETVSQRAAGLLQVLGTCVHGLDGIEVPAGEVAVVIGLGVTGQLMIRLLARAGATVVGITRSEGKRAVAAAHAHAVAGPLEAAGVVAEVAGRAGPALVVEAVGTEATLAQAIELAGPGADVLAFGIVTDGSRGLPYQRLYHQELTLHGRRAALPQDYRRAVSMVADGSLVVDDLVTHLHPLGSFHRAMEDLASPSALKVLLTLS